MTDGRILMQGHNAKRVVIAGQGYVGLPLAMRSVAAGYDVLGYETNESRVSGLMLGESFVEDVPAQQVRDALASGRYAVSSDPSCLTGFDIAVISVPTPLREGAPDLSFVERAAVVVGRHLAEGATVILESTTYPGTTENVLIPILEKESGFRAGEHFMVGYSPERIDPGNPTWHLDNTPKVVSGIDEQSLDAVDAYYSRVVNETVRVSSTAVAELTKLLENTFRHVNIALVNELAMFASDLGIDVWEAIDAASTKPYGYMRFTPGPGVGGHCLPIDPSYLSWQVKRQLGRSFRFIELANDVNDHMPDYVVARLLRAFNMRLRKVLSGSHILLVGLSYKSNTGDARESPAMRVAELLLDLGVRVSAVDSYVHKDQLDPRIRLVEPDPDHFSEVDAILILTAHDNFDLTLLASANTYILDTRHVAPHTECVEFL